MLVRKREPADVAAARKRVLTPVLARKRAPADVAAARKRVLTPVLARKREPADVAAARNLHLKGAQGQTLTLVTTSIVAAAITDPDSSKKIRFSFNGRPER